MPINFSLREARVPPVRPITLRLGNGRSCLTANFWYQDSSGNGHPLLPLPGHYRALRRRLVTSLRQYETLLLG